MNDRNYRVRYQTADHEQPRCGYRGRNVTAAVRRIQDLRLDAAPAPVRAWLEFRLPTWKHGEWAPYKGGQEDD